MDSFQYEPTYSKPHPDIQYFQRIKNTHHYHLHKSKQLKRSPSASSSTEVLAKNRPHIDPYSRTQLESRLKTFNVLNWLVPLETSKVSDLLCARNGWCCLSFSVTNNCKNTLVCGCCHKQLVIRYNDAMNYTVAATSEDYLTDILDAKDYIDINKELEDVYYKQVTGSGHGSSCIWRNFETPLDGVYYLTPHLNSSNTIWINEYLVSLKNLIDNTKTLTECLSNYIVVFDVDDDELMTRFIQVSNKLLLSKHYQDSASGSSTLSSALCYTPSWLYKLAVLGWNLNVQSFGNQLVLLLICSKCNKRIFLDSCNHSPIPKHDVTKVDKNLKLSQANVLSPCPVPITVDYDQDEEEDNQLDLIGEHKPYCSLIQRVDDEKPFHEYFIRMLVDCETILNDQAKFINTNEMLIDMEGSKKRKRTDTFNDINEGIERLNKLKKLYFHQ